MQLSMLGHTGASPPSQGADTRVFLSRAIATRVLQSKWMSLLLTTQAPGNVATSGLDQPQIVVERFTTIGDRMGCPRRPMATVCNRLK